MRKLDIHNAKNDSRIMLTDFSAALDLRSRMTDNCSVDNHAVLDLHFDLTEAREITLTNGSTSKTCTKDVWCFFGRSISSGMKNDHEFHSKCMDYMTKKDNEKEKL